MYGQGKSYIKWEAPEMNEGFALATGEESVIKKHEIWL